MGVLHTPKATWGPCAPLSPLAMLLGGEVQLEVLLHVYHVEEAAPLIALADAARKRTPPSPPISSGAGAQRPGQGGLGTRSPDAPDGCRWEFPAGHRFLQEGGEGVGGGRPAGPPQQDPKPGPTSSMGHTRLSITAGSSAAPRTASRAGRSTLPCSRMRTCSHHTRSPHVPPPVPHPPGLLPTGQRGSGTKGWQEVRRKPSQKSASSWRADGTAGLSWKCL